MAKIRGDRSKTVGSTKKSAGPAATSKSVAKKPAGRSVLQPKGRESITTGYPAK